MRYSHKLTIAAACVFACGAAAAARAQTPAKFDGIGRPATQQEQQAWDIAAGPDGKGLPPGKGTAKEGAAVYAKKCVGCHGQDLQGVGLGTPNAMGPRLIGGKGPLSTDYPPMLVRLYPFTTTAWDYINRAMPKGQERSLTPDEVYAVTAFLLYKNEIIKEDEVMNSTTLYKVQMPNRNGYVPARLEDIHDLQKRGCRLGQCPGTDGK